MSNLAELRVVESITNHLRQDVEIIFVHFGLESEINPERMTGYAGTTEEEGPDLYQGAWRYCMSAGVDHQHYTVDDKVAYIWMLA
jgi:hypothetical protein